MDTLKDIAIVGVAMISAAFLFVAGIATVFCIWLLTVAMATAPIWVPLTIIVALVRWMFF